MASIFTHGLSFTPQEFQDYVIGPLFVNRDDIKGSFTVYTDVKGSKPLDYFSPLSKITKAYAKGSSFTSSTGATVTRKTLTVSDMKAEIQQDGREFEGLVTQALLGSGVDESRLEDGNFFKELLVDLFGDAIVHDLRMQAYFGDTTKEDVTAGVPDGSLDANYSVYNGYWTTIINDFDNSTIPAGQLVDLNTSTYVNTVAVKEVDTVTLTGVSGTANVNINGTDYLATFNTSLTQTAADFVTSHAATIAARWGKLVVTSTGADIIVTAGVAGMPQQDPTVTNVTGNLAGTNANTTANVATGTLKEDAALTAFKAMWAASPKALRQFRNDGTLRIKVTDSLYDNYTETIENLNGSDIAQRTLVDGVSTLTFRGIPVQAESDWDMHIEDDFMSVRPHRALLTVPRNLAWGTDGEDDDMKFEMFYDQVEQDNYIRCEYKAGTMYIHSEYIVAAY